MLRRGEPSEIISAEDLLRKMRAGYKADLEIKYGELRVPIRLLTAEQEATIIAQAKIGVKVPAGVDPELFTSLAVMKAILEATATVESTPRLPRALLDQLTNFEIESLYDQYLTVTRRVNPEFESLTPEELAELISAVKKNEKTTSELFTWQLAAIGKYFLDHIPRQGSGAGF